MTAALVLLAPDRTWGRRLRRAGVAVGGSAVVLVGLVLVPLPGPGWVVVAAGAGLLGTEFAWAARLSDRLRGAVTGSVRVAGRVPGGRVLLAGLVLASTVLPFALL